MKKKVNLLTAQFEKWSIEDRIKAIFDNFDPNKILITSSFGSSSAILLHLLSKTKADHPVYFIDTGYHFEETKKYLQLVKEQLSLNIKSINASANKFSFTENNKTFLYNQDLCCYINKVEPLEQLKLKHEIWISGLFKYQNVNRQNLEFFEQKKDIIKTYPLLDMSPEDVDTYFFINELPNHPLLYKGYGSIGCTHCTIKGNGRDGRWAGKSKIECGIHL